jgi:hypothetical protein
MGLRAIRDRARGGYLAEARGAVAVDVAAYARDLKSYVSQLSMGAERTKQRYDAGDPDVRERYKNYAPSGYPWKDARIDVADRVRETKRNMEGVARQIAAAVGRVEVWSGTPLMVRPNYRYSENHWGAEMRPEGAPTDATVDFVGGRNAPGFTLFSDGTVDDVLDAGDRDFFTDPAVEADYFALVSELRSPGSTARTGKVVTLFTARPRKDRAQYDGAKAIPHGIFLTTGEDRAYRLGMDLGGERDVYRVRIDSRHLVQTLDAGGVREYQAVGRGTVPVVSIDLVA